MQQASGDGAAVWSRDPVSGEEVADDTYTAEYAGLTYRFASAENLARFEEEPDLFTNTLVSGLPEGELAQYDRGLRPEGDPHSSSATLPPTATLDQPRVESGSG